MAEQLTDPNVINPVGSREVQIFNYTYKTNLPDTVSIKDVFTVDSYNLPGLNPRILDQMPEGRFDFEYESGGIEDPDDDFNIHVPNFPKVVDVVKMDKGSTVGTESFIVDGWFLGNGMDKLMSGLGYVIQDHRIVGIPSPERVKACASTMGVDIILTDTEYIQGRDYLQAFADGKYPVSVGTERLYGHDIGDDHLTTMVLGGDVLKKSLADVAKKALELNDQKNIDQLTSRIDTFTATLRAVITPHDGILGEAYGDEEGRRTYHESAANIGLDPESAKTILEHAQESAKSMGIPVKNLR